eukprot:18158-Pleurochrysis_carterae.AAC.1
MAAPSLFASQALHGAHVLKQDCGELCNLGRPNAPSLYCEFDNFANKRLRENSALQWKTIPAFNSTAIFLELRFNWRE